MPKLTRRIKLEMTDKYLEISAKIMGKIEQILILRKELESLEAEKLKLGRELRK